MQIVGGGICTSTQSLEDRKDVYDMTLEEVLTQFAEGLENVADYEEEFDFIRGMNSGNVEDSEEYKNIDSKYKELKEKYKNLDSKYKELKEKYKKKFIDSLTKPVNTVEEEDEEEDEEEEDEEEDEEKEEIKIEDLDLTGIND